jgi:hypothetical protein
MSALLNIAKETRENLTLAKRWRPYLGTFLNLAAQETQKLYLTKVNQYVTARREAGKPINLSEMKEKALGLVLEHHLIPAIDEKTMAVWDPKSGKSKSKPMAKAMKAEVIEILNEKRRLLGEKDFYIMAKEFYDGDQNEEAVKAYFQEGVASIPDLIANAQKVKPEELRAKIFKHIVDNMLVADIIDTPLFATVVQFTTDNEGQYIYTLYSLMDRLGSKFEKSYDSLTVGRWVWKLVSDNRVNAIIRGKGNAALIPASVFEMLKNVRYLTFEDYIVIVKIYRSWNVSDGTIAKFLLDNENIHEDDAKKLRLMIA